ncbi:MAG: hypothetical protein ABI151_02135 [Chitinophagaceae bacterium]
MYRPTTSFKTTILEKVLSLLEIINILLESKEYENLASIGYQHSFNEKDTGRMNNVYQYLIKNFTEVISLSQIPSIANLTLRTTPSQYRKEYNRLSQ